MATRGGRNKIMSLTYLVHLGFTLPPYLSWRIPEGHSTDAFLFPFF